MRPGRAAKDWHHATTDWTTRNSGRGRPCVLVLRATKQCTSHHAPITTTAHLCQVHLLLSPYSHSSRRIRSHSRLPARSTMRPNSRSYRSIRSMQLATYRRREQDFPTPGGSTPAHRPSTFLPSCATRHLDPSISSKPAAHHTTSSSRPFSCLRPVLSSSRPNLRSARRSDVHIHSSTHRQPDP